MLLVYPEQLRIELSKKLCTAYFLIGNEPLFLKESYDEVRRAAFARGFYEHHTFQINSNTDWKVIFSLCRNTSLFGTRKTIQLLLPEHEHNSDVNTKLKTLVSLLYDDVLLIVRGNKLTKSQESSSWFKVLSPSSVKIFCFTPKLKNLAHWVFSRAKKHGLQLDDEACQLLCYYYEGNLLALTQELEKLSALWPDGKLTLLRIKQTVNDSSHFTPIHWIDALLTAENKRALHILQQLRLEGTDPVVLIRILQRELFFLLHFQRESIRTPMCILIDKYLAQKNRKIIMSDALERLNAKQIRHAIYLLTRIELMIKKDYTQSVWSELETLSLLLCDKELSSVFIYG